MAIETKIEGNLESIQSGVDWLRGTFGAAVADSAADAARAGADSAHDWIGATGDAFRAEATGLRDQADELTTGVETVAEGFDGYADALRAALRKIDDVRGTAAGAGLELTDTQILPPGAEPTVPDGKAAKAAAADALAEYRRKVAAFEAAAEDVKRVKTDLATALQELVNVGSKLGDLAERLDWSQAGDSKLLDVLRRGGRAFGHAGTAMTGLDIALRAIDGEKPGNNLARALGEELGGWAELASNHPRAAALLRSLGVDPDEHDFGELGGDYAEQLYEKLPPGYRDSIDMAARAPVTAPEALWNVLSDEFEGSGPPPGFGTPLPGESEAFEGMVEQGVEGVDNARDMLEGGRNLAESGRDHLDDLVDGVKPRVPSWP